MLPRCDRTQDSNEVQCGDLRQPNHRSGLAECRVGHVVCLVLHCFGALSVELRHLFLADLFEVLQIKPIGPLRSTRHIKDLPGLTQDQNLWANRRTNNKMDKSWFEFVTRFREMLALDKNHRTCKDHVALVVFERHMGRKVAS